MKRVNLIIILMLILFVPNVYAFNFTCDNCLESKSGDGSCNHGDTFYCRLSGDEARYDYIKGTVKTNDYVKCTLASTSLDNITDNSRTFNIKGTPSGSIIALISCEVTGQLTYNTYVTPLIDDFEYSINKEISSERLTATTPTPGGIKINQVDASDIIVKNRDTTHEDSLIKKLDIKGYNIGFSKFKTEYELTVPYDVTALEISLELNRADAQYDTQGDPKNLVVGENVLDFIVTSSSKNETWYTITVTRNPEGKSVYEAKKDATLKGLVVNGYPFDFKTEVDTYDITVKKGTTGLHVAATPTVNGATYKINYPSKYYNGAKVEVIVTSSDNTTTKTYTINIHGGGGSANEGLNENIINILIIGGTVIILSAVIVVVFLKLKKGKTKKKAIKDAKEVAKAEMPLPKEPTFNVPARAPIGNAETITRDNIQAPGTPPVTLPSTYNGNANMPIPPVAPPVQPGQQPPNNNQGGYYNKF